MSDNTFGFSPIVWLEALFKRITDGVGGRGGLEAFVTYFDQIDFIPELTPLLREMKANNIFFETALSQCNKELLKRPRKLREREISWLMGCKCNKCLGQTTFWAAIELHNRCSCGGAYKSAYVDVFKQLLHEHISVTPEAMLMSAAYDQLSEAYVNAYKALRLVMDKTAEMFNWEAFRIEDPQLRNYLDQLFFGRLTGETKIPREEKETLQLIIRASIAGVSIDVVEPFIHKAMDIVKYGYIFEVLTCTGAKAMYDETTAESGPLYNKINKQIRETLKDSYATAKHRVVHISKTAGGYYPPCLQMARQSWESGKLSNTITLEPVYRFPIFPKAESAALQLIFARMGAGKTVLLSSMTCYAVDSKKEIVFSPLNDKSQSFSFACMPLFEYDKRTADLAAFLKEHLDVEPHGVPTLTLTVLHKDGKNKLNHDQHPPTKFDRILEVEDPRGFEVNFKELVSELKEIAGEYGFSKPLGIICVRNLDRMDAVSNTNIDVQAAMNLLMQFDVWRKSNLSQRARLSIDELSYLAPSQVILYAGDASRSGAAISDVIKESRRSRTSIDSATQLPLEILPEIRNASTNVFFRDLAMSKDKSKSQIEFVLESLQLEDPSIKGVVRDINNRGSLPKSYWFWYHRPARSIEIIRPSPPTFCLQDSHRTPLQLFKLYEKKTGQKVLLKSWNEVPVLSTEKKRPRKGVKERGFY